MTDHTFEKVQASKSRMRKLRDKWDSSKQDALRNRSQLQKAGSFRNKRMTDLGEEDYYTIH